MIRNRVFVVVVGVYLHPEIYVNENKKYENKNKLMTWMRDK